MERWNRNARQLVDNVDGLLQATIKSLFGHATKVTFTTRKPRSTKGIYGQFAIQNPAEEGGDISRYVRMHRDLEFSEAEARTFDELMIALRTYLNMDFEIGRVAHYTTGLFSYLADATIARVAVADQSLNFYWKFQQLIQLAKRLSFERYEGSPATCGFVIRWNDSSGFSRSKTWRHTKFESPIALDDDFWASPLAYRLVDGNRSFYICRGKSNLRTFDITGVVNLSQGAIGDAFDRLNHEHVRPVLEKAGSNAIALIVNSQSEVEVVRPDGVIFVWRSGNWSIHDPSLYRDFVSGSAEAPDFVTQLPKILYGLSKARHGAAILVPDSIEDLPVKISSVGGKSDFPVRLLKTIEGRSIRSLRDAGALFGMLSSDGLTIVSGDGTVHRTGWIIKITKSKSASGGGRTAAAVSASMKGRAFKVSEDGPVQLYAMKRLKYQFT